MRAITRAQRILFGVVLDTLADMEIGADRSSYAKDVLAMLASFSGQQQGDILTAVAKPHAEGKKRIGL